MKVATLSIEEQQKCLSTVTRSTYPNVLFYAAAEKPSLFNELVDKILEQPDKKRFYLPVLKIKGHYSINACRRNRST